MSPLLLECECPVQLHTNEFLGGKGALNLAALEP